VFDAWTEANGPHSSNFCAGFVDGYKAQWTSLAPGIMQRIQQSTTQSSGINIKGSNNDVAVNQQVNNNIGGQNGYCSGSGYGHSSPPSSFSDIVVLMDMPDIHLPSQLQSRLLEYVRCVVREENENIQFIIVTNSSALIDKATAEELFMLMPSQQLAEGSNQFVKVSDANMCLMPL